MARKRHKPEEIVTKLRQVEVLHGQGRTTVDAMRSRRSVASSRPVACSDFFITEPSGAQGATDGGGIRHYAYRI